jgi:uncharacterized protein (DUF927 family)
VARLFGDDAMNNKPQLNGGENAAAAWRGDLSLFHSVTDTKAKKLSLPWRGLIEFFQTPKVLAIGAGGEEAAKRSGQLFSAAQFKGRRRKNENALALCALVLDYDHAPPIDEALARWADVAYLAYTTWGHGTDAKGNAYRVILPLAEAIPAALYPALWNLAHTHSGGAIDPNCKDPARIMFLPACPPARMDNFQFLHQGGALLDWRALALDSQATTPPPQKNPIATKPLQIQAGGEWGKYVSEALATAGGKISNTGEGGRNNTLNIEAKKIGELVGAPWAGLSRAEAEAALLAAALGCGLGETEARRTLKSALDAGEKTPRAQPEKRGRGAAVGGAAVGGAAEAEKVRDEISGGFGDVVLPQDDGKPAPEFPHGFYRNQNKLYYLDGSDSKAVALCDALYIEADTQNLHSGERGYLLRFRDWRGTATRREIIDYSLAADGDALAKYLGGRGLGVVKAGLSKTKQKLSEFLTESRPKELINVTNKTGWHGGVFVLPDETIGKSDQRILMQGEEHTAAEIYAKAGTLAQWREHVAALALGNSRAVFAISTAFAAPLVTIGGALSGGFHIFGGSKSGKTTVLKIGCSVWGEPDKYFHAWNSTSVGNEEYALIHNDALLALDELHMADPKKAGAALYLWANEVDKGRGKAAGGLRKPRRWKTLFLSTGERTISAFLEQHTGKAMAGQLARMPDIPADAGGGHGAFEELHGSDTHPDFAARILGAAKRYHGTAGREFVQHAAALGFEQTRQAIDRYTSAFIADEIKGAAISAQVRDVANRFALVAAGGELASAWGVTGWPRGVAAAAAAACFRAWLALRGGVGDIEEQQAIAQARLFFENHWQGRFLRFEEQDAGAIGHDKSGALAGYRRTLDDGMIFYVYPETYRAEICKGLDAAYVSKVLNKHGILRLDAHGKPLNTRLPGISKPIRLYHISDKIFSASENENQNCDFNGAQGAQGAQGLLDNNNYNNNNTLQQANPVPQMLPNQNSRVTEFCAPCAPSIDALGHKKISLESYNKEVCAPVPLVPQQNIDSEKSASVFREIL